MKRQDKFMIPLMLFLAFCSAYVVFKYDLKPSVKNLKSTIVYEREQQKCDSQTILNDDELLQSYLNKAFLDKVNYDDRGGRPPIFYMIKENPTTDEILYTLKDIVENDVNTTRRISRKEYKDVIKEYERIESLDIFEALSRHYTITDISEEVIINYRWDKDKKIKYLDRHVIFPINQAIIVYNDKTNPYMDIYGSDAFVLDKDKKCIFIKQNYLDTFYTHYKEYDIVDNNKTESFYRNYIWELKNIIAHDLAYHTADKINLEHSDEKKIFNGLLHKCVKIDNCGNFDYKNNFVR